MAVETMRRIWWIAVVGLLAGCSGKEEPAPRSPAAQVPGPVPMPGSPPAPSDPRPAILCFGDSITAGFGVGPGQAYPELLQKDIDGRGLKYRVVNMGVSGDTTQDGLGRIQLAVAEKPAIVLLELGGNDGLRGIPISITQNNLAQMIETFQGAGARVVLAGMTLPPNYGQKYITQFEKAYRDLAEKYKVKLIPFLLEGVGGHDEFMQRDGLHPNAAGARKVEALVMKSLGI
jgi:acyl-CoA thioesterase-1